MFRARIAAFQGLMLLPGDLIVGRYPLPGEPLHVTCTKADLFGLHGEINLTLKDISNIYSIYFRMSIRRG